MMVGIIDYGMGNIRSVANAFERIGCEVILCREPEQVAQADRVVLPGVGAFGDCMANLNQSGLRDALEEAVLQRRKPTLGICLGMQIMATSGYEGGRTTGLGWIPADVVPIEAGTTPLRVPHVGWNSVSLNTGLPLFSGFPESADFYFVHSFWMQTADAADVVATVDYGQPLTAAVRRENIMATQFHPEKSQSFGLALLENFVAWKP